MNGSRHSSGAVEEHMGATEETHHIKSDSCHDLTFGWLQLEWASTALVPATS